jgi:hypothetical protein
MFQGFFMSITVYPRTWTSTQNRDMNRDMLNTPFNSILPFCRITATLQKQNKLKPDLPFLIEF